MSDYEYIRTADGSDSIRVKSLDETYHSRHGAVQESEHVFIRNGLLKCAAKANTIKMLEVGFGTGLNALLTVFAAEEKGLDVDYVSLEKYPLPDSMIEKLNYAQTNAEKMVFEKIHTGSWNEPVAIHNRMKLTKLNLDLDNIEFTSVFDLVYYDAFGPRVQPNMWTTEKLKLVAKSMRTGALFVTYCAQGQFRRNLTSVGLKWESLAGPPGKREMTIAWKQ